MVQIKNIYLWDIKINLLFPYGLNHVGASNSCSGCSPGQVLASKICGTAFIAQSTEVNEARDSVVCGNGTFLDVDASSCFCTPDTNDSNDPSLIKLAGIVDTTAYDWAEDVFDVTVQLLNQGAWGVVPPNMTISYSLENGNCDPTTAAQAWWKLRTENGNQPLDGIVGARCSGASVTLARLSGLEHVPHISPMSNSARLSDTQEFPYFSRLVAPNNEKGEGEK